MKFKKEIILLSLFFLIGLFLRIYKLSQIPIGIHGDEASIGYNAYSLLKTGKDQNGNFLPLTIDQFGDYRPPGYHYLDIPFVALFNLNEKAVRLPSAIFGALTVFPLYLLTLELFKNEVLSLLTTLLLSVTPWHINISRATSEGVIAAFLIIFGYYFLAKWFRTKKLSFLSLGGIFLFLSFFFYHSARFFVPCFIPFLIFILNLNYKLKNKKEIFSLIFLIFTLFIGLLIIFKLSKGEARPLNISILNVPGGDKIIYQQIAEDGNQNPLITRFFHNKPIFYLRTFLSSYFLHFSGEFLFNYTGLPIRYRIPWSGNLYLIYLPFIIIGFSKFIIEGLENKKYNSLLPIIWLFMGAIPAGLTYEDIPNIQRSSLMIYSLMIITAKGIYYFFSLIKKGFFKNLLFFSFILIFIQNCLYFFHNYFHHSLTNEPWYRSAAVKELIFSISEISKNYEKIIMTTAGDNHLIHYLFYQRFDPQEFQKIGSPKEYDGLHFLNIVYTHNPCPLKEDSPHQPRFLFVNHSSCSNMPKNSQLIKTIYHPDGTPAYFLLSF